MATEVVPIGAVELITPSAQLVADAALSSRALPCPVPKGDHSEDKVSQEENNLLFLLANIANEDENDEGQEGGGTAHGRAGEDASSSGGSSDTQSKVLSMEGEDPAGGRQQRQAAAQQRLRLRQHAAMEEEEEDDEMGGDTNSEGGDQLSDTDRLKDPLAPLRPRALAAAGVAAAAAAAARGEDEGDAARPTKRPKPNKPLAQLGPRKYVSSQITIPILEAEGCFNMTQVDAARHLGFGSSTVLKKVMRRLGIKQWPYRKRTSAKKITHSLEDYMRKYGDPTKVEAVLERVRMELAVYEASPTGSIPLRPELAALRQRLYKLDNKVKHEFKRDAEAPLRQCVHSLVEKTWQELQPIWMSNLAQQQPMPVSMEAMPLPPMPLPATAPPAAAARVAAAGDGGGVSDTTLMLAMLLAQGMPTGLLLPIAAAAPVLESGATKEEPADAQQEQEQAQPQQAGEPANHEEAEAAAKARVAALAPDLPAAVSAVAAAEAASAAPAAQA